MASEQKIVLVTGANKGLGREISRQLAARGLTVLVGARDEQRGRAAVAELASGGADVRYVHLDVTDEGSAKDAAGYIQQEFGKLDVLINNAGVSTEQRKPVVEVTTDEVRRAIEVNALGIVTVTRAMLPLLRAARGRIINMSTGLGSTQLLADPNGPDMGPDLLAYSSSKAAANMITVLYSRALREEGISVNAVSPGYVATDLNNNSGFRTVEEGAVIAVRVATEDDVPTGTFRNDEGSMVW